MKNNSLIMVREKDNFSAILNKKEYEQKKESFQKRENSTITEEIAQGTYKVNLK